jgi:outer membrane protein TolC
VKDAKFRRDAARRYLANVAGVPELPDGPIVGSLEDNLPELDWETSLARLQGASPLLRSQEAEVRAAQLGVQLARAQAIETQEPHPATTQGAIDSGSLISNWPTTWFD